MCSRNVLNPQMSIFFFKFSRENSFFIHSIWCGAKSLLRCAERDKNQRRANRCFLLCTINFCGGDNSNLQRIRVSLSLSLARSHFQYKRSTEYKALSHSVCACARWLNEFLIRESKLGSIGAVRAEIRGCALQSDAITQGIIRGAIMCPAQWHNQPTALT